MTPTKDFDICGGSIIGTDHFRDDTILKSKNNQDAFKYSIVANRAIIGIVCDGCGSQKHSEVGAWLGVETVVDILGRHVNFYDYSLKHSLGFYFSMINDRLKTNFMQHHVENSYDYWLFTILGFIITKEMTFIFSCGDGLYSINGKVIELGPFDNNSPPYIIYPDSKIKIVEMLDTKDVDSLIIGTDGVVDLKKNVGNLDQWLLENKCFDNPDMLRRKLSIMNHTKYYVNEDNQLAYKSGVLPDDTTLIAIRRR